MALLEVEQLEVVYHKVATAIQGVTLKVRESQVVAVVGTNGAGKTTTLRAISGFLTAEDVAVTDGSIRYRGENIVNKAPHELARRGIVLVPERDKVFETLSVEENLLFNVSMRERRRAALRQVYDYFPAIEQRRTTLAGYLSGGEKQMLAIGMALLCRPQLLLIDELSLGLAPVVVDGIMETLQRLNRDLGFAVLLVEQNAMAALATSHVGYVMEAGQVVYHGTGEELLRHRDIQEFYLGGTQRDLKSYRDVKQYRRKRRWWG
ncbi:MAG: ABC transporter ATP-binding protein [Gammaproteobacteria bacterium]|nr:ABC transporter ATP-binding protein [Gammaproteobacteria bacterium]NIR85913.1 ABC transporter ATP-binding protein [Gammaproteobacteria bacterium]NIR91905.1 ABC transporter ATP-binding protein [Gammaproteobacteria bacterium]NIU07162.1 ABC transporter ATP-binding protein [Gammaproteobacteria bacterium]NIV53975.1 ATP-binding cassette domain-containing protein [Gammaproteobacteria bacterium]